MAKLLKEEKFTIDGTEFRIEYYDDEPLENHQLLIETLEFEPFSEEASLKRRFSGRVVARGRRSVYGLGSKGIARILLLDTFPEGWGGYVRIEWWESPPCN